MTHRVKNFFFGKRKLSAMNRLQTNVARRISGRNSLNLTAKPTPVQYLSSVRVSISGILYHFFTKDILIRFLQLDLSL
ncbi:hypothetical protein HK096_008760 [Nowakowskiella sp. JEL0078]|nr:hypothetical protein HK096_008760 [Nowakowskiella sp. JEL0078]